MKIEIWSDVTCTHCYTAKRKFERALSQFKDRDKIEVVWRSFELAPDYTTNPDMLLPQFLQELQKIDAGQAQGMIDHVTKSVKEVGLTYHLDMAIPANSFNAHRLSHFAKTKRLQDKMEERLFKAYFTEGKNIDDIPTLTALAKEIGLPAAEAEQVLVSSNFAVEVMQDLIEAKKSGIKSVPQYVFNSNTRISGAQDSGVYLELLEKEFAQWKMQNAKSTSEIMDGRSCKVGENC